MPKRTFAYYCIFSTEQLFSLSSQLDLAYTDFPSSTLALGHFGTQSSPYDLMPVAHSNDPDLALCEHLFNEVNESYNPWIIIESIISFPNKGLAKTAHTNGSNTQHKAHFSYASK